MKKKITAAFMIAAVTGLYTQPVWANVFDENLFGFVMSIVDGEVFDSKHGFLVENNGNFYVVTDDYCMNEFSDPPNEFVWFGSGSMERYETEAEKELDALKYTGLLRWKIDNPDSSFPGTEFAGVKQGQKLTVVEFDSYDKGAIHTIEREVIAEDLMDESGRYQLLVSGIDFSEVDYYPAPLLDENGNCVAVAADDEHIWTMQTEPDTFYRNASGDESSDVSITVPETSDGKPDYTNMNTYTDENGNKFYGYIGENGIEGYCMAEYENGDTYEGKYENGMRNGFGIYTFTSGSKIIGTDVDNVTENTAAYIYNDGSIFIGDYIGGVQCGEGILYDAENKELVCGRWEDGKKVEDYNTDTWSMNDDMNCTGTKVDGKLDGMGLYMDASTGEAHIGRFKEGIANGFGMHIYEGGIAQIGNFVNGRLNGYFIHLEDAGYKLIGFYMADEEKFTGKLACYNPDGTMVIMDSKGNEIGSIQR